MTTTPQAALLSDDEIEMLRIQLTTKLASTLAIYGDDAWDQDFARLVEQAVIAKLQATQEPVQAGELPPLPSEAHWEERIKTLMQQTPLPNSMSVYQAFKQLQNEFEREMIAYARAALSALKPLTRKQINEASRDAQISFCLKSGGTYEEELARALERAHGIDLEVKP